MRSIVRLAAACVLFCVFVSTLKSQNRVYYQEPVWQPRGVLSYDDAIGDKFWPKSPAVNISYNDTGFVKSRLGQVPQPGMHPRVLMNSNDVESIRQKVALGANAPLVFRVMWQRVARTQNAFYALVAKDDALGKKLAQKLVEKIESLVPKLDLIDKQPDRDNIWSVDRSIIASGDPNPPTEIWDLLDYDYLYGWMTPQQRQLAQKVIARLVYRRISNFLSEPDHYMINNHLGFGMEYLRLLLLIEGEPGFDQKVFNQSTKKARAMLDWYLDDDGMCFESIKGWLNVSAFVALGQRDRDLLKHDHLRAKMRFFQAALRWENGSWKIRDEMRASAFHVIWMMHYYHPNDEGIDFLYKASIASSPFVTDANVKWPNPVGIANELLLLYADEGLLQKDGKPIDWNNQANVDRLHLPLTWQDNQRGYVETRNTWKKDDLHVGFTCKQDFFYGGHEGSENNRLILWKDGVNWIQDLNMLATKATFLQNMLTIDGKGCHWPPAPGTWLGVQETPAGVVACGDGKNGYSFYKNMQVHPLDFPSAKIPYYAPFAEANFDLTRDLQIAFHPGTVKWTDGFAHTDYGPWSGETRLVENYRPWNTMQRAYRTVQIARGKNPYLLVIDDAQKDNQQHQYDWNISVPIDAELVDAATPEIVFQNTEPSDNRTNDLLLAKNGANKDPLTGKIELKKGDALCLIRVLWRNSNYGFGVPRLEHFQGYSHVTIPAMSVSPEFKILVYPHQYGDPLPKTTWNKDRTLLTIQIGDKIDVYRFGEADGGRTVFAMESNGKEVLSSNIPPARPVFLVRGEKFDINDLRYTRNENKMPVYQMDGTGKIEFVRVNAPAQIRYTLDGTTPTAQSPVYEAPILINKTCYIKAVVFNSQWPCSNKQSEVVTASCQVQNRAIGLENAPAGSSAGLLSTVYELKTKIWNDKGFFDASKIMLPNLAKERAMLATNVNSFQLPHVVPQQPVEKQCKGFYRFTGYFLSKEAGVYNFDVNSCGPVTLDIANKSVIEQTGMFHQQQQHRNGEVVLGEGWHTIDLVVCDPLFWNSNSLDAMTFEVAYRVNGNQLQTITGNQLCFVPLAQQSLSQPPTIHWHEAIAATPLIEPGLELEIFDRTGRRRDNDFLDVQALEPMRTEMVNTMEPNLSRNIVKKYSGYFYAAESGIYNFSMPARNGESAGLGALQASCQNQLTIDSEIVVQRGVAGRNPLGLVGLKAGWHTIAMHFGPSVAIAKATLPDGQTIPLTAAALFRPVFVNIRPVTATIQQRSYEVFKPTAIALEFSSNNQAVIRYSLNGAIPNSNSPIYTQPFLLNQTTTVTAVAFVGQKAITVPAMATIYLVKKPEAGLLGAAYFSGWNGKSVALDIKGKYQVWIAPGGTITQGIHGNALAVGDNAADSLPGVDVNVSRGAIKAGFKLHHIAMRESALTVSLWFKTAEKTGKLFGKDGYNAFGKVYKTFSCSINNGRVEAFPGRLIGGKIQPNTWQHIVLTANEFEMSLYLNGVQIATGQGTRDLTTDALDFFVGHKAVVDSVTMFDRLLSKEEVKQLYEAESK